MTTTSEGPRYSLVPGLEPRPLTMEEYHEYAPEKVELLGGYVFGDPDWPEIGRKTLLVVLTNMGLVEAVKMVPEDLWREALVRAYGSREHQGG